MRLYFGLLAIALAAASPPAMAQSNLVPLLQDSAAERFDVEDLHMILNTARKTVNEAPDNQMVSWENADTKHRGDFTTMRIVSPVLW